MMHSCALVCTSCWYVRQDEMLLLCCTNECPLKGDLCLGICDRFLVWHAVCPRAHAERQRMQLLLSTVNCMLIRAKKANSRENLRVGLP
jgi:hypothetical protein